MSDLSLNIAIKANADQAMSAISRMFKNLPGPMGVAAGAAVAVGAAVVGIGIASTKMAAAYDQNLRKVQALTGANTQEMKGYDASLKTLAVNAGVAPTKLADGLYNVMSAGYKGKDAMNVLTLATEDAKIGMTSAAVTSDSLTNIMASFSVKASDANRVNGEMLQTVTLGKATFEQYASSIVKSASSASQFHVSMETMNAAWSTMTSNGIRAAQASTDFQSSLKVMYSNIGTVTKSLQKNGIAFDEAKFNTMSYGDKVKYLNTALQQANDKHVKVTGATLQATQAISTIAQHIDTYNSNLKSLSDKQAMAEKTQKAWGVTQGGFNQTMDRLHATLDVVMISIGQKLLPVVTSLANQIIPVIQNVGDWLIKSGALNDAANFLSTSINDVVTVISTLVSWGLRLVDFFQHNEFAMDVFKALVVGTGVAVTLFAMTQIPAMLVSLGTWAVAQWAVAAAVLATAAPFIVIGILVAAVVLGIILAIQHWGAIMDWISGKSEQVRIKQEVTQEKQKDTAVQKTEEQKKGVLKQLEDERQQTIKKIQDMADGSDKEREKMHLKDLDKQIKATKDQLKELDKQHAQHMAKLKQLAADDLEARKNWYDRANDATTAWFDSWKGILVKWYNNANDAVTKWFDSWKGILAKWYNNANDTVTKWFDSWKGIVSRWVQDSLNRVGQMKDGFIAKLGQLKDQGIAKAQQIIQGIANFFMSLPGKALGWGQSMIQGFINGIMSKVGNILGAIGNIAQIVDDHMPHSPAKKGPLSKLNLYGPALVNTFAKDIASTSPKARQAAEGMMASVAKAIKSNSDQIAMAHINGDKGLEKSLRKQQSYLQAQMKLYKDLATGHGYKISTKDINNMIIFGGGSSADKSGLSAIAQFTKDIKTNTPKAHQAAQQMMLGVTNALAKYPAAIAQAHLQGNKIQEAALRKQYTNMKDQMLLMQKLLMQNGFMYDAKSTSAPINFKPVLQLHGSTSTTANSGGASSSGNGGLIINNTITINAQNANAQDIYKIVMKNITRDLSRSGGLVTTSSGGRI